MKRIGLKTINVAMLVGAATFTAMSGARGFAQELSSESWTKHVVHEGLATMTAVAIWITSGLATTLA